MSVTITFLGGTDTVTGSKYLVAHDKRRLLVDCGLFQGVKQLRLRNWAPLPVVPGQIDAVALTHAHLDHSGYLPLLVREGFAGKAFATHATRDLCKILLPDSGYLQEEDAAFANRHGFSKHAPARPLYTRNDAVASLKQIKGVAFGRAVSPMPGWRLTFHEAGHILGAASVLVEVAGRRILFSGDLGRSDDLIMRAPAPAPVADTVLIESTYGDREHPHDDLLTELGPLLKAVAARGGVAVVPVFAVGRAQALLHAIDLLKSRRLIPRALPVYLDSPMAVHSTHLFEQHAGLHRLTQKQALALTRSATMVAGTDASKALARRHGPMVILSASGMATGGRVLHHLAHYLGDHRNMVILTGFQAPGTRGASLAAGADMLRIHGRDVAVQAPGQVYVVHGERNASDALRKRIQHELGWRAVVPEHGSTWPS